MSLSDVAVPINGDAEQTRRASPKHIKAYLKACAELIGRVEALLLELVAKGEPPRKIDEIANFLKHAVPQINQIDRRILKGETIPHNEKVFSIFEPHTRWISKGQAGCLVELGVPVCIIEYQYRFILHYEKSLCILFRPYQHSVGQGLLATTFCRNIVPSEQNA